MHKRGSNKMSTRSQILFRDKYTKVMIYRHSDGYPTGALSDLVKFFQWNQGRNSDLSYSVANFIYFMKKEMEQYCDYFETNEMTNHNNYVTNYQDKKYAENRNLSTKLGYGFVDANTLSDWIEYFYDVEFRHITPKGQKLDMNNEDRFSIVIRAYAVNLDKVVSVKKFLVDAKLIQTVVLDVKGNILSNEILDKESEPFQELVVQ